MHIIRKRRREELTSLLQALHASWGDEGSAPRALSDLLEVAADTSSPTATAPHHPSDDAVESGDNSAVQLRMLSEVARIALSRNGGGGGGSGGGGGDGGARATPRARSRALALDCLRLGLRHLPDGKRLEGAGASDALHIAAVGAEDERWNVRVAAAGVAGEALRKAEVGALLSLLSSKQGCWLPAMLVDGFHEVEQAARAALSPFSGRLGDGNSNDDDDELGVDELNHDHDHEGGPHLPSVEVGPPTSPSCPSSSPSVVDVASAAMRNACRVLREVAASSREDEGLLVADSRVTDLAAEETTRRALRALRGGVSLLGSPGLSPRPSAAQEVAAVRVEALGAIEVWLAGMLTGPPVSLAWGAGVNQGASRSGDAPLGDLSGETRDAVRALLLTGAGHGGGGVGGGGVRVAALEAAEEAVEGFRAECLRPVSGGSKEQREEDKEDDEEFWRNVYAGLLVRLEVIAPPLEGAAAIDRSEGDAALSPEGRLTGKRRPSSQQHLTPAPPESTRGGADQAGDEERSALTRLAGKVAEALDEVPPAHEQALPPHMDDNDKLSVRDKKALRSLGDRRRRWMVSSTHLLLRAGARFCTGDEFSASAMVAGGAKERGTVTAKLLVASLAFEKSASRSDDPTEAWLSCVRLEPLDRATGPILPPSPTTVPAAIDAAAAAAAAAATELATPIPWELCVRGQALPRHELAAPWASSPITAKLAEELVEAAWGALSLSDSGPVAKRSAEMLVQELRATARVRGWREGAGVGVKHAISAVIRRLRFPLVAGATLGHALPLALPLADDYDPAHQALGLSLLLRVGLEATPTELAWHRGLLLEVLERGLRGGGRNPSASLLCLAAAVRLLRSASGDDAGAGGAGVRIAREALAQAGRTSDGVVRVVMVSGAAALLELPATGKGYAPCELLRPALLCLLPILQSSSVSASLDARGATLRALHALCLSCWPRVHAHASKLLCALLWTCGDCSRRASARKSPPATPLGVAVATSSALALDETIRAHATRVGALVLVLAGGPARSTLREVCSAVSALRPEGCAMEQLADGVVVVEGRMSARGLGRGGNGGGDDASDAGPSCQRGGGGVASASDPASAAAAAAAVAV